MRCPIVTERLSAPARKEPTGLAVQSTSNARLSFGFRTFSQIHVICPLSNPRNPSKPSGACAIHNRIIHFGVYVNSYLFSRHMAEPSARSHRKLKNRKTFLRLLRQVIEEAHMRQSDLAKALGSTQAYVSKYELGERRLDLLDLSAVCEAVGIPLLEFVR